MPVPPPSSALSSLPDKAAVVDTGHVLVKDTGVEASEAPVTQQLGLTVSFQEGEEEHGTATNATGGDFVTTSAPIRGSTPA